MDFTAYQNDIEKFAEFLLQPINIELEAITNLPHTTKQEARAVQRRIAKLKAIYDITSKPPKLSVAYIAKQLNIPYTDALQITGGKRILRLDFAQHSQETIINLVSLGRESSLPVCRWCRSAFSEMLDEVMKNDPVLARKIQPEAMKVIGEVTTMVDPETGEKFYNLDELCDNLGLDRDKEFSRIITDPVLSRGLRMS